MSSIQDLRARVAAIVTGRLARLGLISPTPPDPSYAEDDYIDLIEEIEQAIKNYCNIYVIPEELKYVWAGMVVDYVQWLAKAAVSEEDAESGSSGARTFMSSIRVGDTTIGFSADSIAEKERAGHLMRMGEFVFNYEDSLNRFRRVVW